MAILPTFILSREDSDCSVSSERKFQSQSQNASFKDSEYNVQSVGASKVGVEGNFRLPSPTFGKISFVTLQW